MNAKDQILDFIQKNPSCLTSDIINEFNLPIEYIFDVLDRLQHENKISGKVQWVNKK